jgi:hypothetical protein
MEFDEINQSVIILLEGNSYTLTCIVLKNLFYIRKSAYKISKCGHIYNETFRCILYVKIIYNKPSTLYNWYFM